MVRSIALLGVFLLFAGVSRTCESAPPGEDLAPDLVKLDAAESDAALRQVLADWAKRRERFKSVEYTLTGEKIELGRDVSGKAHPGPVKCHLVIDFGGRRVRYERSDEVYGPEPRFRPRTRIALREGDRLIEHTPQPPGLRDRRNLWTTFSYDIAQREVFEPDLAPLLYGHGYVGRASAALADFAATEATEFEVAGVATWDGRECLVLRTEFGQGDRSTYVEHWIDAARGAAIVRTFRMIDDVPVQETNTTYAPVERDWLPTGWTWKWREMPGAQPRRVVTHTVTERKADPDPSGITFWLEPKEGHYFIKDQKIWRHNGDNPPTDLIKERERQRRERRSGPKIS